MATRRMMYHNAGAGALVADNSNPRTGKVDLRLSAEALHYSRESGGVAQSERAEQLTLTI